MLNFGKIAVLLILVFSLVACSSAPTNVSKEYHKEFMEIQSNIDECFSDDNCNYLETNEITNNTLLEINPQTEEENEILMDNINLLTTLVLYKSEYEEFERMQLELDYKKLHNKISEQLNGNKKYLN